MDFDKWLKELAREIERVFAINDGKEYIDATGHECWREMFDDGMSPSDAAGEEAYAAAQDMVL